MAVAGAGEARQDARMSGQGTEPRINLHAPTRHLAGFRSISTERATQCSSGPLGGMAGRTFSSANAPLEALRVQPCSPASRSAWHVRMTLGRVPFRVRLIEPTLRTCARPWPSLGAMPNLSTSSARLDEPISHVCTKLHGAARSSAAVAQLRTPPAQPRTTQAVLRA